MSKWVDATVDGALELGVTDLTQSCFLKVDSVFFGTATYWHDGPTLNPLKSGIGSGPNTGLECTWTMEYK